MADPNPASVASGTEPGAPNAVPSRKRPYKKLHLLEFGDVRTLTRGTATVGQDGLNTNKNPQCLPPDASIATPNGFVLAADVREGTVVWTSTRTGERVAAPVILVGSQAVASTHRMIRLELADGRTVTASALHPILDGRPFSALVAGDLLDGAAIVQRTEIPYDRPRTYDLLPTGTTGSYWANGVLIGSTLTIAAIRRLSAQAAAAHI